ncbi:MAG: hypothetical protein ABW110_14835 [Steroidobacteraceae bacterium]
MRTLNVNCASQTARASFDPARYTELPPTSNARCACLAVSMASAMLSVGALAQSDPVEDLTAQSKFCSATAETLRRACRADAVGDYWTTFGICTNEPDDVDRPECFADAQSELTENRALCRDQFEARQEACGLLGEARYHPEFEPGQFDADYTHLSNPNAYFPLGIGNQWEFHSETQTTKVEVLDQTKLIDEVRCIVVLDEVREEGKLIESTKDWFAQAKLGDVWYCGEETRSFETFKGDRPPRPELVSIEGSFKAGRDGDEPGIIFRAAPVVGEVYREEASLGTAEDAAEVLSTTYAYGKDPALDEFVPADLATLLCNGDCVVTRNFSVIEPDVFERKYYAPGIGVFLEVEPESQEVVRLVKCNVDPRCGSLPH